MLPDLTLYVGEARLLAVRILRNGSAVTPDSATFRAVRVNGDVVVAEGAAGITGNRLYTLIGPNDVTEATGGYVVVWKAVYEDEIYIVTQRITVTSP